MAMGLLLRFGPMAAVLLGFGAAQGCAAGFQAAALDPCVGEYLAAYRAGRRLEPAPGCDWGALQSQERADAIQAQIVQRHPAGGKTIGYKVANARDGRVVGALTDAMLLPSGAVIELASGARLLSEGDLLLRIRSPAINEARTLEEAAAQIDAAIPFIESSDMMLPQGAPRTKPVWTATNGNARWGLVGETLDLSDLAPSERMRRLGELEVALSNAAGEELQRAGMRNNPLQSVLEVLADLRRRGAPGLQAGDLVSVGNFGRPRFPRPGDQYRARYLGLAEPAPEVLAVYR